MILNIQGIADAHTHTLAETHTDTPSLTYTPLNTRTANAHAAITHYPLRTSHRYRTYPDTDAHVTHTTAKTHTG